MKRLALTLALLGTVANIAPVFAYSEMHDEYTMELKGFSPEMIEPSTLTINRMEDRFPQAPPSRLKYFFYNIYNNNYVEALQPFGQDVIRRPTYPRVPQTRSRIDN